MRDLIKRLVAMPFAINAISLFVAMVSLFPFGGWVVDVYRRKVIMTLGAGVNDVDSLAIWTAWHLFPRSGGNGEDFLCKHLPGTFLLFGVMRHFTKHPPKIWKCRAGDEVKWNIVADEAPEIVSSPARPDVARSRHSIRR